MKFFSYFLFALFFTLLFSSGAFTQNAPSSYKIQTDGKETWPPQGPNCEQFVNCCTAAEKIERSAGLFCKLTAAKKPLDCLEGLKTVGQYLHEKGASAPVICRTAK